MSWPNPRVLLPLWEEVACEAGRRWSLSELGDRRELFERSENPAGDKMRRALDLLIAEPQGPEPSSCQPGVALPIADRIVERPTTRRRLSQTKSRT